MEKEILKIESMLYDIAINMNMPTIEEDLGVLIFEATLYKYSKEEKYKTKALELLNKAIEVFPSKELSMGFLEGFEGLFWVVSYLNSCNIIPDESLIDDLRPHLLQSLKIDIKENNFDVLHGSLNKLNFLLNSKNQNNEETIFYVNQFVDSLFDNKEENERGIYWYDSFFENKKSLVNLGLAHGVSSVLVFLSKLKKEGYKNQKIDLLIEGVIKSLLSFKNKNTCSSYFPSDYSEQHKNTDSRLAWCNGDLGIAYALLYSAEILEKEDVKTQAIKVVNSIIDRRISNSSIDHFEENFFFDTAFCHGISGIVYTLSKINKFLNNDVVEKRINYWKGELVNNLKMQLSIEDDIYYPSYKQDKGGSYTLDTCSMLSGLTGTGLVLLSLNYDRYDWSDFFLLY